LIILVGIAAIFGADPMAGDLARRLEGPGPEALLGRDQLGRDLLARTAAGFVWSASVAASATLIAAVIGVSLGLAGAGSPGFARSVVRWGTDTAIALPGLIVAIIVVGVVGQGWLPLTLTLGLLGWPVFTRITLLQAQSLMAREFVQAARVAGAGGGAILFGHVAPNLRAAVGTAATFQFAEMMIAESALSFLGLAAPLGAPTWGAMMAESRGFVLSAPAMLLAPAAAMVLTVVAVTLIGDGLARRRGAR
jgi:peptide/nickel transport system permease protein